jgi:hypothetical protein
VLTANIAAFFVEVDEEDTSTDVRERLDRIEHLLHELLAEKTAITARAALMQRDDADDLDDRRAST